MGPGSDSPEDVGRLISKLQARQVGLELENEALRGELQVLRAAMEELRARHDELDLMIDTVPLSMAYTDADYNILHANQKMAAWWGYTKQEVVGRNFQDVAIPGGFEAAKPFILQAKATRQTVAHERTAIGRDGKIHILRQSYSPHMDDAGNVQGFAGMMIDITEERRTEEALREQARQVAIAAERNRLSRDLHDAATQTIYSAMLIAEALPQVWARNPVEGERNLVKLRQLVRGALAEMRTLLFELRPWTLETVELRRLLEYLKDSLTGRARVNVELDIRVGHELPPDTKTTVYRIAQEAFNNIVKHARASQVRVTLRNEDGRVRLSIEDDGRGFDPEAVATDCLGLQIMRERAAAIGGELQIMSVSGQGTTLEVAWVAQEESHA